MHQEVGPTEHDPKVEAPTLLIMGEEDYAMKLMEEYVTPTILMFNLIF